MAWQTNYQMPSSVFKVSIIAYTLVLPEYDNDSEGRVWATISVSCEYYYIYLGPTSVLQIILRGGWGPPSVFKVSIITYT